MTLEKMAKQTGRGLDETRAALLTQIAWGTAAANVDIATIKEHKVFELTLLSEGLSATDLDPARRILHGLQELAAPASGRVPQDAHAIAKDCAAARARATTVHGGEIHADGWNYAKDVEMCGATARCASSSVRAPDLTRTADTWSRSHVKRRPSR